MKSIAPNLFLLFAMTSSACTADAFAEAPQPVKGTHVVLEAPAGFTASKTFPGFESEDTGASLIVGEMQTPFAEMSKELNASGFKTQGMTLLSRESADYGELEGVILATVQTAGKVDYVKWIGAFGDETSTYMVTATFPKEQSQLSDSLKESVLTARVERRAALAQEENQPKEDKQPKMESLDSLPFRVTPTGDMEIAQVVAGSIVLSQGGVFPVKDIQTPVFVAGAALRKDLTIEDPRAFAEARLQHLATLKNIKVTGSQKITIDKITGYEFLAQAVDKASGAKAIAYQVILFDDGGYYLMQGIASAADAVSQLEKFKTISRSFRRQEQ